MALDFQVPDWLQPATQAQSQQLQLQQDAARERAGLMLRKQMGFARMKAEADQLAQQGVDPLTARKTALFNNAHLLFADNPNAVSKLVNNEQLQAERAKATEERMLYHQATNERLRLKDEALQAEREAGRLTRDQFNQAQLEIRAQKLQNDALKNQLDIEARNNDRMVRQNEEAGRNTRASAANRQRTAIAIMKDPALRDLRKNLEDAQADVVMAKREAPGMFGRIGIGKTSATIAEDVQAAQSKVEEIQKQIDARQAELMRMVNGEAQQETMPQTETAPQSDAQDPLGLGDLLKK